MERELWNGGKLFALEICAICTNTYQLDFLSRSQRSNPQSLSVSSSFADQVLLCLKSTPFWPHWKKKVESWTSKATRR